MVEISGGVCHDLPEDMKQKLSADEALLDRRNLLTPLARNEWICRVTIVQKPETRANHIERLAHDILDGKKRPCCRPGCPHRRESAKKWFK